MSIIDIKLRPPKPGDESKLAELGGELGYPSTASDVSKRLGRFMGRDDHLVLIAVDREDSPIAWIQVYLVYRVTSDGFAEVGGMIVSENYRSAGIGESLLMAAENWARVRGVETMRIRSNVVRERAHRFYLGAGYQQAKTSHVFQKRLQ